MFRHLRLRLTLLYFLAAAVLVALVAGSAYRLVGYYFETTTNLALQHRMAAELRQLGAPVPPELAAADDAWTASRDGGLAGFGTPDGRRVKVEKHEDDDHGRDDDEEGAEREEAYDGDLAAIFVLSLRADGRPLFNPNSAAPPMPPDQAAVAAALRQGYDWRSVRLSGGTRLRLLTYRVGRNDGPALLQVGRALADQDRVLSQLILGLLGVGGASALFLGAGSWWLAGRTLRPAQVAWERQQTFVANASHELRTPLTLMRASAEVTLRQTPANDADQRALLNDVLQEADHMARLVEDLLLLSRLDAGKLAIERKAIVLPELLADVQRQFGRVAVEHSVDIAVGEVNGVARGDPDRLRQVLLILLDNALRHTPAGGRIRLEARAVGRRVEVVVADTGIGIPPEHLPHIFERFYRVDPARSAEGGGSGLGLAIARALITAQHGVICLTSRLGHGTRVVVTLPSA